MSAIEMSINYYWLIGKKMFNTEKIEKITISDIKIQYPITVENSAQNHWSSKKIWIVNHSSINWT
jgi:hypothetical protein